MRAKQVEFEVTYIDLTDKPDWFLAISPHGKVPVLKVNDQILFESNAIAEYLDEVVSPRVHPEDPIKRAQNRAWTDFVPDFAKALSATYYTKSREETDKAIEAAPKAIAKIEDAIARERGNDGPYFNGDTLQQEIRGAVDPARFLGGLAVRQNSGGGGIAPPTGFQGIAAEGATGFFRRFFRLRHTVLSVPSDSRKSSFGFSSPVPARTSPPSSI